MWIIGNQCGQCACASKGSDGYCLPQFNWTPTFSSTHFIGGCLATGCLPTNTPSYHPVATPPHYHHHLHHSILFPLPH